MTIPVFLKEFLRTLCFLWQRFDRHQGLLRASALSFDTTLGLVPLLAMVFVGLKLAGIQQLLGPFLLEQLAGSSQESATRIVQYVDNVKIGSLSIFGLVALFVSLFSLLENTRDAFNAIWETQERRSLLRRSADYLLLLCAAPALLAVAFGMTSFVQSQWLVQWLVVNTPLGERVLLVFRLTPFICSSLVLMLTYRLLSGVVVHLRPALAGGLVAGAAWQMAHWAYFHFQFGVARYNAMYGALAMLPFLLIWIYASWLLVLLGLELVRCFQQGGLKVDGATPVEEGRS